MFPFMGIHIYVHTRKAEVSYWAERGGESQAEERLPNVRWAISSCQRIVRVGACRASVVVTTTTTMMVVMMTTTMDSLQGKPVQTNILMSNFWKTQTIWPSPRFFTAAAIVIPLCVSPGAHTTVTTANLQKGRNTVHRHVKKLLWHLPAAQVVAPHDEQNALTTTMVMVMLLMMMMMMMMMIICQGWRENSARYTYNN